ncbi:MAG: heavy metal transporter [Halobacteriales archaeon SW_8_66_22]|nr:MAG: heavy metal transporter [Halobacteriales archaeon SW_8_66_22]
MDRRTLSVTGMACNGCEESVKNSLLALGDVNSVEADHETDTVEVVAAEAVSDDELADAVRDAGYEVES